MGSRRRVRVSLDLLRGFRVAARHLSFTRAAQELEGSGVAIGKRPHLARYLEEGLLRAPFGADWVATPGSFCLVVAPGVAQRELVAAFVFWLRGQLHGAGAPAPAARPQPRARGV